MQNEVTQNVLARYSTVIFLRLADIKRTQGLSVTCRPDLKIWASDSYTWFRALYGVTHTHTWHTGACVHLVFAVRNFYPL